jgi:hypothetical protein
MKDVAIVDLVSAFAFKLALELHSYLERDWGWGRARRESVGGCEMYGIWRKRTGVDEQE